MTNAKWKVVAGSQNHHLYKRGDSPFFWVRYSKAGKERLEKSLKTDKLGEARIERDRAIATYLGKKATFDGNALVEENFEEWRKLNVGRKATQESIKYQWEGHLQPYFGKMLIEEITASEWLKYVAQSRSKKPDRKFFNDRKWLMMFLNWAYEMELIGRVPKLANVDPPRAKGKIFSPEELNRLFLHSNYELHLQIIMGLTMGMRLNEIMSMAWEQVDLEHGFATVTVANAKIKKERKFALSPEVWNVLKGRRETTKSPFVFHNPSDPSRPQGRQGNKTAWTTCREKAGVTGRFHYLRKTFITLAIRQGGNAFMICDYAGLSMKQAQETYAIFSAEEVRPVADLVRY